MTNYNHVAIMGRLVRDPEIKFLPSGSEVCNFDIAYDTGYGEKEKVNFIKCKAWKNSAKFLSQYCHKGDMILIDGELQQEKWVNESDGKDNSRHVVNCRDVKLILKKKTDDKQPDLLDGIPVDTSWDSAEPF